MDNTLNFTGLHDISKPTYQIIRGHFMLSKSALEHLQNRKPVWVGVECWNYHGGILQEGICEIEFIREIRRNEF